MSPHEARVLVRRGRGRRPRREDRRYQSAAFLHGRDLDQGITSVALGGARARRVMLPAGYDDLRTAATRSSTSCMDCRVEARRTRETTGSSMRLRGPGRRSSSSPGCARRRHDQSTSTGGVGRNWSTYVATEAPALHRLAFSDDPKRSGPRDRRRLGGRLRRGGHGPQPPEPLLGDRVVVGTSTRPTPPALGAWRTDAVAIVHRLIGGLQTRSADRRHRRSSRSTSAVEMAALPRLRTSDLDRRASTQAQSAARLRPRTGERTRRALWQASAAVPVAADWRSRNLAATVVNADA